MNKNFDKLVRFCLYRERCTSEVEKKLYTLKVSKTNQAKIIKQLHDEGYLNEERFVSAYINSRVYLKRWGKIKIQYELRSKKIPSDLIEQGLKEIEEENYLNNLDHLASLKKEEMERKNKEDIKPAVIRYLAGKGYESDLIFDWIKKVKW